MRKEGGKAKKKRGKNSAEKPEAGGRGEAAERKRPNRKRKRAGVRMPADRTSDGRRAIKRNKAPLFGGAKGHFARMRCPVISR